MRGRRFIFFPASSTEVGSLRLEISFGEEEEGSTSIIDDRLYLGNCHHRAFDCFRRFVEDVGFDMFRLEFVPPIPYKKLLGFCETFKSN